MPGSNPSKKNTEKALITEIQDCLSFLFSMRLKFEKSSVGPFDETENCYRISSAESKPFYISVGFWRDFNTVKSASTSFEGRAVGFSLRQGRNLENFLNELKKVVRARPANSGAGAGGGAGASAAVVGSRSVSGSTSRSGFFPTGKGPDTTSHTSVSKQHQA
jgi:hypothetical protein